MRVQFGVASAAIAFCALCSTSVRAGDAERLVHDAVVDGSVEEVWAAWATSEGLEGWLAPHADIDLRIGGKMRTVYDPNGQLGDPATIENTILSYEPERMLSIQVSKAPEGFPFPDAIGRMWTVVYLEGESPETTRVRIVGMGFSSDEESVRMREFFDGGNAQTLRQLQRHFGQRRSE